MEGVHWVPQSPILLFFSKENGDVAFYSKLTGSKVSTPSRYNQLYLESVVYFAKHGTIA